jgi:hypothetical protein
MISQITRTEIASQTSHVMSLLVEYIPGPPFLLLGAAAL